MAELLRCAGQQSVVHLLARAGKEYRFELIQFTLHLSRACGLGNILQSLMATPAHLCPLQQGKPGGGGITSFASFSQLSQRIF